VSARVQIVVFIERSYSSGSVGRFFLSRFRISSSVLVWVSGGVDVDGFVSDDRYFMLFLDEVDDGASTAGVGEGAAAFGSGSSRSSSSAADSGASESGSGSPIRTSLDAPPLWKTALSWVTDSTLMPLHSSPGFMNLGSLKSFRVESFLSSTMTWYSWVFGS